MDHHTLAKTEADYQQEDEEDSIEAAGHRRHGINIVQPDGTMTVIPSDPSAAQAEVQRILNDPTHPYRVATHSRHREAVEMVKALHQIAHPEPTE